MSSESDLKKRIRGTESENEFKERARNEAIKHQQKIIEVLREMNKNFLLILKVNNYMNNIDKKLGMPINNYYYTAKFSLKRYYKHCL